MQNLKIFYEDNHIIVARKPNNVPSQGDKTGDEDMLTMLKSYLKEKYHKPRRGLFRACSPIGPSDGWRHGFCQNFEGSR